MSKGFQLRPISGGNLLPISDGSVIGRGELFQVDDKRVSRQHAEFEIKDNKLFLKPLHTNPCFLQCNSGSGHITITKGERRQLEHNDTFSLLPDALQYQVVENTQDNVDLVMTVEEVKEPHEGEDTDVKDLEDSIKENKVELKGSPDDNNTSHDKLDGEGDEEEEDDEESEEGKDEEKDSQGDVALPSDKPRTLPDWMIGSANKIPGEETANGNVTKKVTTKKGGPKATKRGRPKLEENKKQQKKIESGSEEDDVSEEEIHRPTRRRLRADSDDDTEEEPISVRRPSRRASQNKQYSDEFLVSDEEEIVESEEDTKRKGKKKKVPTATLR